MHTEQIKLVQESWKIIKESESCFAELIYSKLFEINPDVRSLFPHNLSDQKLSLISMFDMVIGKLHRFEEIELPIRRLGFAHVSLGVEDKHYKQVEDAIITSLRELLGDNLPITLETSWRMAYGKISKTMISGANESFADKNSNEPLSAVWFV